MGATGGQPPFDHRKIPESPDDIDTGRSHLGCLFVVGLLVLVSVALYILDVRV
jgi:hypothetical protein